MKLHGLSSIAGQPGTVGGTTFRAVNPATLEPLETVFHEASELEVDQAMNASTAAFEQWRVCPGEQRALFLEAIAEEIEALGESLLACAHAETGLPMPRLLGERARTCGQLRIFATVAREGSWVDARIDSALPQRQPLPRPDLRRCLIPLGPVVVFGSSNFPLAFSVAGGDTASAFAAGCTVVVKAHRAHPGTSELVGSAVNRAVASCGLPPGIFSYIHGNGAVVGMAMARHPATSAVAFTGSHAAGRALYDAASARPRPIPVFAEMSSLNPVFLLPGALAEGGEKLAQGLLASCTLGIGQFCTKPGLVFMLRSADADAFLQSLGALVRSAPSGVMLTSGIRTAFTEHRDAIIRVPGVRLLASAEATPAALGAQIQPSVAVTTAHDFLATPTLATEAFGPFALAVLAESADEILACAATLEGQLTATIHGNSADLMSARTLLAHLEQRAGRIVINAFPTGVEVCHAMNHGGPYPATTDTRYTSVGTAAMLRFARPVCYQDMPDDLLPPALQHANPLTIRRLLNGESTPGEG